MRVLSVMLLASMLALAGCSVRTPGAHVRVDPGLDIHVGDGGAPHGGRFCPPGQAKKGNC